MSYLDIIFLNNINKNNVNIIFELGSRDLVDAVKLSEYYNAKIYSFEPNPDSLVECKKTLFTIQNNILKDNIFLIEKAVSLTNGPVLFYPFDLTQYNNMGASSMLKIDFSKRNTNDPDYNRPNPQKEIYVDGIRLDTFIKEQNIPQIDLLCIDLQGYELNALKSLGDSIRKVKYIITECSITSTYINGSDFTELNDYLMKYNFRYCCSNTFQYNNPDLNIKSFSEFDALFINMS